MRRGAIVATAVNQTCFTNAFTRRRRRARVAALLPLSAVSVRQRRHAARTMALSPLR